MKSCLCAALFLISVASVGQPLRDINYQYLYNPDAPVQLELKVVRSGSAYTVLHNLHVKDTSALMSEYALQWEGRSMLSDKEGIAVALNDLVISRHRSGFQGRGTIAINGAPRYLVAKVINNTTRTAWLFFAELSEKYPVNNFLLRNGFPVSDTFVRTGDRLAFGFDSSSWIVSYYNHNFPAAAPVFSEAQARVSKVMRVDSVFTIRGNEEFGFAQSGLYLIQKDTNAVEGIAVRSEEDYPQYSKLINLAAPLVYITTRQEYDRLVSAQGNKKAFDRVILNIVTDTDRARTLMRNYFKRVEMANRFFTSYKEGWKTDRGMVYIIFGIPNQVYKFADREVWSYKTSQFDTSFTFTRSSSLFDPENYVLIREKRYEDTWYEVIDLWRNARF